MKLTQKQLNQIIKEELEAVVEEQQLDELGIGKGPMHDMLERVRGYDGPVPQGRWEKGRWQARR